MVTNIAETCKTTHKASKCEVVQKVSRHVTWKTEARMAGCVSAQPSYVYVQKLDVVLKSREDTFTQCLLMRLKLTC